MVVGTIHGLNFNWKANWRPGKVKRSVLAFIVLIAHCSRTLVSGRHALPKRARQRRKQYIWEAPDKRNHFSSLCPSHCCESQCQCLSGCPSEPWEAVFLPPFPSSLRQRINNSCQAFELNLQWFLPTFCTFTPFQDTQVTTVAFYFLFLFPSLNQGREDPEQTVQSPQQGCHQNTHKSETAHAC